MTDIATNYQGAHPFQTVADALEQLAPGEAPITMEQLGGGDEFHSAGRMATVAQADLLDPGADDTVLDAGCGLGGPARYLAERFGCHVIGVDLTSEFIEAAQLINARVGMGDRVEFRLGDITDLDVADTAVDHVFTQHVAMNIADRPGLYSETRRVMRPGGRFVLFDVIDGGGGETVLPVPWASEPAHSHLVTADALRGLLTDAGFDVDVWEDPTAAMVEATRAMFAGPPPGAPPPPFTPMNFISEFPTRIANYLRNMEEGRTSLVRVRCVAT